MQLFQVDDSGALFISPAVNDWAPLQERGIDAVIDLDGGLDHCIPTIPNQVLYVYFPIFDEDLPNLSRLNAVADLGAALIKGGQRVLSHCGMGFNRSALVAGLILLRLGVSGPEAVKAVASLPAWRALQRGLRGASAVARPAESRLSMSRTDKPVSRLSVKPGPSREGAVRANTRLSP